MERFLIESAYNVLKNSLQVQATEEILLVADDQQDSEIIEAFFIAGRLLKAKVGYMVYPAVATQNAEPPSFVHVALQQVDAAVVIPVVSITHVEAIREARKQGTRVLVCSGLDRRMMMGAVNADYQKLSSLTETLKNKLEQTDQVRVTSEAGTDLVFSIKGRSTMSVDGICNKKGAWNFAPAGTTATAPVTGSSKGTIVFDGSLAPFGIVDQPVVLTVREGNVTDIKGGRIAEKFRNLLTSYENPNVYNIAEIGIGTNEKAELSGKLIEDERILGAFHVGIGKSLNIGGEIDAPFHTDGMILAPTVYLDDKCVVKEGEILV